LEFLICSLYGLHGRYRRTKGVGQIVLRNEWEFIVSLKGSEDDKDNLEAMLAKGD
jgi:hypothetical protein